MIKGGNTDQVYSEIKTPPTPTPTTTPTDTVVTTNPAAAAGLQGEFKISTCAAYEPTSVWTTGETGCRISH